VFPNQKHHYDPITPKRKEGTFVFLFIAFEFVCQLALLSNGLQAFRIVFRMAAFGFSLALLALLPGRAQSLHPAANWAKWVLAIMLLSILNPATNSLLAGVAEIAMYLAILGPLFWVPRFPLHTDTLRRAFVMIWAFQTLSAVVGILQVYYPGRFQPALSAMVLNQGWHGENLKFVNAFGEKVFRPMGLTDSPGGAASAGFYAALLGLALFSSEGKTVRSAAYAFSMIVGVTSIYLSQVRVALIVLAVCAISYVSLLSWWKVRNTARLPKRTSKQLARFRLVPIIALAAVTAIGGFAWAVSVGGKNVSERFASLTAEDPRQVYGRNRGMFLWYTIDTLLPEYPIGAGLGRWGTMSYYFGNPENLESPFLYSEIQWTAWLYDGGLPLIAAYLAIVLIATGGAYRIARDNDDQELAAFGALIVAYDLGALAATFDANNFMSQDGLNFWLFNALLFSAAYYHRRIGKKKELSPARFFRIA
jgi:hypothetical protein